MADDVWIRPWLSVTGTRHGAGPPSCFMRLQTPSPLTRNVTPLKPPMSDSARPPARRRSPAHPGRVALVHPEQIASEQVGLLTTSAPRISTITFLPSLGSFGSRSSFSSWVRRSMSASAEATSSRNSLRSSPSASRRALAAARSSRASGRDSSRRSARARSSGEQPPGSAAGRRSAPGRRGARALDALARGQRRAQHDHRAYGVTGASRRASQ